METKEHQNKLHLIRKYCNEFSDNTISLKRIDHDEFILSNSKWPEEIILSHSMIEGFIQVGYFDLVNVFDFDTLLIGQQAEVRLHISMINRSDRNLGLNEIAPIISFIGGVIILLLSLYLYLSNSVTTGYFGFRRTGTYSIESGQTLSWFHLFIIGMFLIVASVGFKYLTRQDKK